MATIEAQREKERQIIKENWGQFRDRLVADPDELKKQASLNDLRALAQWMQASNRRAMYSQKNWSILAAPIPMK